MADDTANADANPHHTDLREAAVDAALHEAGLKVRPRCAAGTPGTQCRTWGEKIYKYQKSVGAPKGTDYCVAFVYWCFEQAAKGTEPPVANPLPRMSGVRQVIDLASRGGCFVFPPKKGDVFILYKVEGKKKVPDHVGFVVDAAVGADGKLTSPFSTVEGNTWVVEGVWGVHARKRDVKEGVDYRFARF